jgi:predicted lipoprotein with Yx(FWY)xxD motif
MARQALLNVTLALGLLLVGISAGRAQEATIVVVGYSQHPTLGTILTDSAGITLYTWDGDTQSAGRSNCYDACAAAWPPMLVDEISAGLIMGTRATPIGAIIRTDTTHQLTYDGWPLYSFARDAAPGEANGEGSAGFGARWSVVPIAPQLWGAGG